MTKIIKNKITDLDIKSVFLDSGIDWEIFRDKVIYITGATGVIGSFIVRCLLNANKKAKLNLKVVAAVRNIDTAKIFFNKKKVKTKNFELYKNDVIDELNYKGKIDYVIHAASNTSSTSFVEKPVETFNVAVKGTENLLNFAQRKSVESMVYLSSMEVYGNINEPKLLKENDLGDLDINEARSSYPLGKRAAESLCYSFAKEYEVPVKVVRLAQVIGSNVAYDDTRVYAHFARSIVEKRDIILNTTAETTRSYCYITDVVAGILTVLTKGKNGECYNIANEESSYRICDIAKSLCEQYTSSNLVFDIKESNRFYKETHWVLDNSKLKLLGWEASVDLKKAYERLINSFYYQKNKIENKQTDILQQFVTIKKRKKYTWAEKIFSVKNDKKYKIIKILNCKIKINRFSLYKKYYDLPIEQNKIVFANFKGNGYGCNPKYIAEEIIKRKIPCKLVWLVKSSADKSNFPSEIKLVDYNSKEAIKELATAKIWIDNQRKIQHLKKGLIKREEQFYIQTWHGSLGIKKIGLASPISQINNSWIPFGEIDAQMIDILLSNSQFENDVFKDNFWGHGELKLLGHPRNDVFFKDSKSIKDKFCANLGIDPNLNLLLYAPSYREDGRVDCFGIDADLILKTLEEKTGKEWAFIVRMHPNITKISSILFDIDNKKIFDGSRYPDIQEILSSVDAMITDYSSCVFDFMLSRKPAFIFATDIEEFNSERGFYYPLESTPFPIATNSLELEENIIKFDYEKYKNEVGTFLQEKGCMEDGQASKRVVDLIEQIINK